MASRLAQPSSWAPEGQVFQQARLKVTFTTVNGTGLLSLAGGLDFSTAEIFAAKVASLRGLVFVDCKQLTFVDSTGFGALVALSKQTDSLVLCGTTSELREVLHIMNLQGGITIRSDR